MLGLKLGDIEAFPFVDPPDSRFVKDGFRLLFELGAVDERQHLSPLGRKLARLPIDPRLARMVLAGAEFGSLRDVLIVVSALAIQDPRDRPADKRQAADQAHQRWHDPDSDFVALLNLWHGIENAREAVGQSTAPLVPRSLHQLPAHARVARYLPPAASTAARYGYRRTRAACT